MLSAAVELFYKEGYDGVGVQKIVDVCGVQKPTLYHYFGSKAGIMKEISGKYFTPFLNELETACIFNGDLTSTLENAAMTHFRFAAGNPSVYGLYLGVMTGPTESEAAEIFMPVVETQYSIIETMFRSAENAHGNMRGRSKRYSITFIGHINAYITAWHYGQMALSSESAYLACKHYMHGILS